MDKLLIITGPTATGKTSLGLRLARGFSGEMVNADSRQVYRGMDVGTGKEVQNSKFKIQSSREEKYNIGYYSISGIRVWLLDIVKPSYRFSAADYISCAVPVIKDIWRRGKLPILVGGTGFYIKALVDGIGTMGIKPDWELREKLQNLKVSRLQNLLKEVDIERYNRMNQSDKNNPRRLIRAIEVAQRLKNENLTLGAADKSLEVGGENMLMLGLEASQKTLYERISARVKKRLGQGLLREIKSLIQDGYNFTNSVLGTTLAYKEWQGYFSGDKSLGEVVQEWQRDEYHYARRQLVWFRKEKRMRWFDITANDFPKNVERLARRWYDKVKRAKN